MNANNAMNVMIYVENEAMVKKIKNLFASNKINYNYYLSCDFDETNSVFDNHEIDVFLCQLGLQYIQAKELFQLAKLSNTDMLLIGMGDENCQEELLDIFNTETLFEFITLPMLHSTQLLEPISNAIEYMAQTNNRSIKIQKMEESISLLNTRIDDTQLTLKAHAKFTDECSEILKVIIENALDFNPNLNKNRLVNQLQQTYRNYIFNYFKCTDSLEDRLSELISRYNNPEKNQHFNILCGNDIKNNSNKIDSICYTLSTMAYFLTTIQNTYNISCIVALKNQHLLLKITYKFDEEQQSLTSKYFFENEGHQILYDLFNQQINKFAYEIHETELIYKIIII